MFDIVPPATSCTHIALGVVMAHMHGTDAVPGLPERPDAPSTLTLSRPMLLKRHMLPHLRLDQSMVQVGWVAGFPYIEATNPIGLPRLR